MSKFKDCTIVGAPCWIRHIEKRCYHFIRIRDLHEWVGKEQAEREGGRYMCDLTVIDLDKVPQDELESARDDQDDQDAYDNEPTPEAKDEYQVQLSVVYGSGYDLSSRVGNSPKYLFKQASKISHARDSVTKPVGWYQEIAELNGFPRHSKED